MVRLEAVYTHGSPDRPPLEVLLLITTNALLNIPEMTDCLTDWLID